MRLSGLMSLFAEEDVQWATVMETLGGDPNRNARLSQLRVPACNAIVAIDLA